MIVIAPAGDDADAAARSATWLVREPGSGTRAVTEECFAALGIDPPRLSIASNGAISACVRAGLGYSLVSRDGVERELRAGAVGRFRRRSRRSIAGGLVAARDRDLPDTVGRFVRFAVESGGFTGERTDASNPRATRLHGNSRDEHTFRSMNTLEKTICFALAIAARCLPISVCSPACARTIAPDANAVSRGRIYYHLTPPVASTAGLEEYLELRGGRYTDLAMSNYVAGVILGGLSKTISPASASTKTISTA